MKDLFKGLYFNDFTVTLNDVYYERIKCVPDKASLEAIKRFKAYVTKRNNVDTSSAVWKGYEKSFIKTVVMESSFWPIHLPIGFVFVSFILSTEPNEYKISNLNEIFKSWIESNREDLFKAHDDKRFLMKDPEEIDYIKAAESLYGDIPTKPINQQKLDL